MDIIGMLGKGENIESVFKNVCPKPKKSEKVEKDPKQCMPSCSEDSRYDCRHSIIIVYLGDIKFLSKQQA